MGKTEFKVEPGKQEVIMTRTFSAPAERIFKAFIDPEQVKQWWGGGLYKTEIDKMDARVGGQWRFLHIDKDGEYAFHGVYHDVVPNERLVYTFEYEGVPGHVLLETITLEEVDGKTKVTDAAVYQSIEDRDGMVSMGMETGATAAMEKLAELVES